MTSVASLSVPCSAALGLFEFAYNRLAGLESLWREKKAEAHIPHRTCVALGLFNVLDDAKEENDLVRRDALLAELGALATAHPDAVEVRELLAMGLLNALIHATDAGDLVRRDLERRGPAVAALQELLIVQTRVAIHNRLAFCVEPPRAPRELHRSQRDFHETTLLRSALFTRKRYFPYAQPFLAIRIKGPHGPKPGDP